MGCITIHISKALTVPQPKGPVNKLIISGTSLRFGLFFKLVFSLLPKYILWVFFHFSHHLLSFAHGHCCFLWVQAESRDCSTSTYSFHCQNYFCYPGADDILYHCSPSFRLPGQWGTYSQSKKFLATHKLTERDAALTTFIPDGGRQISVSQSYLRAGEPGVMLSKYYLCVGMFITFVIKEIFTLC